MGQGSWIELRAGAFLAVAVAVLMLPLWFVVSLIIAATFHEFCHYFALIVADVKVFRITIGPIGASMETESMDPGRELLCAMAGPLGSLVLVPFYRWVPGIAFCGLIQGFFNLIPIYPMDGGRVLKCLLELLRIPQRDEICNTVEWMTVFWILILGFWGKWHWDLGWGGAIVGVILFLRLIRRKIPCKERRFRVQ